MRSIILLKSSFIVIVDNVDDSLVIINLLLLFLLSNTIFSIITIGNVVAALSVEKNNLVFIKNTTLRWYQSSSIARRGFCSECGTSILWEGTDTTTIILTTTLTLL